MDAENTLTLKAECFLGGTLSGWKKYEQKSDSCLIPVFRRARSVMTPINALIDTGGHVNTIATIAASAKRGAD